MTSIITGLILIKIHTFMFAQFFSFFLLINILKKKFGSKVKPLKLLKQWATQIDSKKHQLFLIKSSANFKRFAIYRFLTEFKKSEKHLNFMLLVEV
jgi:hypothetical protein